MWMWIQEIIVLKYEMINIISRRNFNVPRNLWKQEISGYYIMKTKDRERRQFWVIIMFWKLINWNGVSVPKLYDLYYDRQIISIAVIN